MKFGPVDLTGADGAVLAHTHRLPGGVLRKGTVLDAAALAMLRGAGLQQVIAAQLEPGDVGENEAASRLAAALAGPGLRATVASTGRVNLMVKQAGLLTVDRAMLDALNAIDEALTVATAPDRTSVAAGDMVATIKIIPFAVAGPVLEHAIATAGRPLALHGYRAHRVGLVMTSLPGLKPSILDGTAQATRDRVHGLGGTLLPPVTVAHDTAAIAAALGAMGSGGCGDADILLIAGASAVVDRRDVAPAGIVAAGGVIEHFGMPVDPGNLICLGRIGTRPALVLPGCARSPKLNGIDWVLQLLFAGLPCDGATVARMGVGGLLKDVGPRPAPRAGLPPARQGVAAIVLAAGRSSRMAPHHKLLLPDRDGRPMVARVVDHVLASAARPVIVVTGHRAAEVQGALAGRDVQFVHAAAFADGLSASLRAGLAAVPPGAAALVCLGDMPLVTGTILDTLIDAYDPAEGRAIVAPAHQGRIGNPVLWGPGYHAEIAALTGDAGARRLLDRHADAVMTIETGSDAVLRDFDTVESLTTMEVQ